MSNLFNMPRVEAQNASGGVLAGAKLEFFQTGTSTNLDTYSDDALTTANANPVVADSGGRWTAIFLRDQDYKVTLSDSADVQIWSADPYHPGVDNFADDTIRSTLDTTGSANAYALTVNRVITAYANGDLFIAKSNFENTASATLNVTGGQSGASALGAKTMKKHRDLNLTAGDIESGQWCLWRYDGTNMQLLSPLATVPLVPYNVLINGDFHVTQQGTSFTSATTPTNNDGNYLLDRWVLLSDTNDVVDITQETSTVPVGSYAAIRLDVETTNKKFGIAQIVEGKDAEALIGGKCSLSFQARRTGTSIDHLRAAVLGWASTVDVVTSDVVDGTNWNAAGTDPTLATSWSYENTPASLATLTTSFQTFKIENISIDTSSVTNIAVFIWIDDTTTTLGDFLYITDVQLERGPSATPFHRRPMGQELALCQRYFNLFTPPTNGRFAVGQCLTTTTATCAMSFSNMRIAPTAAYTTASGFSVLQADGTAEAVSTIATDFRSVSLISFDITVAANLVAGNATLLYSGAGAATISLDAEL